MTARLLLAAVLALGTTTASMCGSPVPPQPPAALGGSAGTGGSAGEAGAVNFVPCQAACDNLARLGCPEDQTDCLAQCILLTTDSRFAFNVDCRINARTQAEAQACGPASCRK